MILKPKFDVAKAGSNSVLFDFIGRRTCKTRKARILLYEPYKNDEVYIVYTGGGEITLEL